MKNIGFILYDNRSGSTLLSALLNCCRGIAVSIETDVVYQVLEYPKRIVSKQSLDRFVNFLYTETRFSELKIERELLCRNIGEVQREITKHDLLSAILGIYFRQTDPQATWWIVKGPRTIFHLTTLHKMYPMAKFIHIVRDGRAVFHSKRNTPSLSYQRGNYIARGPMSRNLIHSAHTWRRCLQIVERHQDFVKSIRYEDLVNSPDLVLGSIFDAWGVSPDERAKSKTQQHYFEQLDVNYHSLHNNVRTKVRDSIAVKWTTELPETQIYLYEKIDRDVLLRYGYDFLQLSKPHNCAFLIKTFLLANYYWLMMGYEKVSNLFYYLFYAKKFWVKLTSKLYEFKEDAAKL